MPYTTEQQREILAKYGLDPERYEVIPDDEWGAPPAAPVAPPAPTSTALGAAFRGAKRSLLPSLAGIAGTVGTAALLGPGTQPAAAILLPLAGGLGAGFGTGYLQEKISPTTPEQAAQRAADVKEHPVASVAGELAPGLVALKPSLSNVKGAFSRLPAAGVDDAARNAIVAQRLNVGLGAGLGALSEVGVPLVRGEDISPARAASATIAGALLNEPNQLGRMLGFPATQPLRPSYSPAIRPGVGYDAPIGPPAGPYHAEGLAMSQLTPQDSYLTRVYRQYYDGREAAPAAPRPPAPPEPSVEIGRGEVEVGNVVHPDDREVVIGRHEESSAEFEARIAIEARAKEIARLEGEIAQAEAQIRHLPFAERTLKQVVLDDARLKLAIEKVHLDSERVVYVSPKGEEISPKPNLPAGTPQEKIAREQAAVAKTKNAPRRTKPVPVRPAGAKAPAVLPAVPRAKAAPVPAGKPVPAPELQPAAGGTVPKPPAGGAQPKVSHAPDPIAQPEGVPTKPVGVQPGKNVPADQTKVRKTPGAKAGVGGSVSRGSGTIAGWTKNPELQYPGVKASELTPEQAAQLPRVWEYTDRRAKSPTLGFTVYVKETATPKEIEAAIAQKTKEKFVADSNKLLLLKAELGISFEQGQQLLIGNTPFERGMTLLMALQEKGIITKVLEHTPKGHREALEKALQQAAAKVKEITGLDVSFKAGPGEGKDIMYQAESQVAAAPLETLLQHPNNREVFELLRKIGARHGIEMGIEPSLTDAAGDVKLGMAVFKDRLVKLNAALVAEDTLAHEITHILLRDMINADDPLAMRGLALFGGHEERLVQALGTRVTDLAKMQVEGLTLKRFTEWVKDLFAAIKTRWFNGSEDDFRRLLARRIIRGEKYQPVRLIVTDPKEVAYQGLVNQQQDAREGLEAALAARTIAVEHGIPGMRSVVDRIKREVHPDLGDGLANVDREADRYRGRFTNKFQAGVETLSRAEREEALRYVYEVADTKGNPTFQPSDKVLDWYEKSYRAGFRDVAAAHREVGKKIIEGGEGRDIYETPYYTPEMLREDVQDLLLNHPNDPQAIKYRDQIVEHIAAEKGITKEEAFATWETRGRAEHVGNQEGMLEYGPLSRAAGIGLPASVRESDLSRLLTRYGNRAAAALAWHKHVVSDQKVAYLAGVPDQFGKPHVRPEDLPADVVPYGRVPIVAEAIRILKGDFSPSDRFFDSFSRGVTAMMMQTLTGAVDLTTWWAQVMPYIHPSRLGNIATAHLRVKEGIQHGLAMGVIQKHALRMQSVMEGGEMKGVSRWITRFNKLSDAINTITGRDGLERVTRGLTMILGEMEAVANLGHAFNPASPKAMREHAWKFLDTFADKNWADSLGSIVKAGQPVPDEIIQRIAANLVDAAQGTYSIRGLPLAALKGEVSPFLSLARWNIEKANNFQKHVWAPLLRGNLTPFLMTTAGGLLGGAAVEQLREWMTKRKGAQPTWAEIAEAGGDGMMYKAMALSSFSGFGGIITELAKQGFDVVEGRPVTGFRFPAIAFIADTVERGSQAFHAVNQGENLLSTFGVAFPLQMLQDHVQMARVGLNWSVNREDVEKANQLRDLRTFRELRGLPTIRWSGGGRNPFLSSVERDFERTEDVSQAVQGAAQLRRRALSQARDAETGQLDPERLRSLLQSYRTPAADVMPSLRSNPRQFQQYLEWVRATQGEDTARALLAQHIQKQRLDRLKAGLLPTLSRP